MKAGLVADFGSPEVMRAAVRALRERGYLLLDTFTPFPLEPVEHELGLRRSRIAAVVLLGGVTGASFAFFLQWWINVVDYPLNVGGRPFNSAPAFIPLTFITTVLAAGFTAFFALWFFCGLPRVAHPIFDADGFERVSRDGFFVGVDVKDPAFDLDATRRLLEELGALRVSSFGEVS